MTATWEGDMREQERQEALAGVLEALKQRHPDPARAAACFKLLRHLDCHSGMLNAQDSPWIPDRPPQNRTAQLSPGSLARLPLRLRMRLAPRSSTATSPD